MFCLYMCIYIYDLYMCVSVFLYIFQCFSNARPWPGTGPWHQLFRAARGSGICHFSFLNIFYE